MKFERMSTFLSRLDATSSRLEITGILSELFRESSTDEIDKVCYLILGSLAPQYRNIVFNIADKMMLQMVAKATGVSIDKVKDEYRRIGDLGNVVENLSKSKGVSMSKTTVLKVYDDLLGIAEDEGEGSVERKIEKTSQILSGLDPVSAKYVVRIALGKLRLGFSDKTIIDALSWMDTNSKSNSRRIEEAYNVLPDVGMLAKKIKEIGIEKAVVNISPVVGVPVIPALAQRLKSPKEMIEKMEEVAIEPKFDGLRIQIHFKKLRTKELKNLKTEKLKNTKTSANKYEYEVKAFTRNMNETSWMFPELKNISDYINADEIILDSEAVGVDEQRMEMANFQTTMTRRRKYDIGEISKKVGIKFHVFDCLSINGRNLMDGPYLKRREVLEKYVKSGKLLEVVPYIITKDPKVIEYQMKRMLSKGLEGIIVKRVSSEYSSGRTGWRWVKMKEKEDSIAKLADTIDCVVMGYYMGRGKRSGFGLGGFLGGIVMKGKKESEIRTLTKIGTGLTDEQFKELKRRLYNLEVKDKPKEYGNVDKILLPDVWVTPSLVIEIAADDITKSPNQSSGYSLRFPRLVKFRDDKNWDQATTLEEIVRIFKMKG